jgi:hypothetical protein
MPKIDENFDHNIDDSRSDWLCMECGSGVAYETIDEVLSAIEQQVRTSGSKRARSVPARIPAAHKALGPWSEPLNEIFNCLSPNSSTKVSRKKILWKKLCTPVKRVPPKIIRSSFFVVAAKDLPKKFLVLIYLQWVYGSLNF